MSIKAIIWDMGGVILRTEDRGSRRRWEARLGLADSELDEVVFPSRASQRATIGEGSSEEVWTSVAERFGLTPDERKQLELDFWAGDRVDRELLDFIRQLRPERKTALLSNAWPGVRALIEDEWEFADVFDEIIISAEVGLAKPDPEIYRLTLARLQVQPEQAVFIDDFSENLEGARALGMRAIRFVSRVQVEEQLLSLLAEEG